MGAPLSILPRANYGGPMFHLTEAVGEDFDVEKLRHAQAVGWQILRAVANELRPGSTLKDAKRLLAAQMKNAGLVKHWHPPQLRLGKSSICHFNAPPVSDAPLQTNDIFFLDIGPLVGGYEADVGRTFTLGDDPDMKRCARDAATIHKEGIAHWLDTKCSGAELYTWTQARADALGWQLQREGATGHRVGDFPHHRFSRKHLINCDFSVAPNRWIYEVHLRDRHDRFGAFYEDLLA
jgi:Xaa-Pro aminopeptidase